MLTGELRSKIDAVWNAFWDGGISNPIEMIEQITYLLFIRGLDDLQTSYDRQVNRFGSAIRKALVEDHKLDEIIKLPWGVFRPYAGVSTAIVLFTKTNAGGTDHVLFYDVAADDISLDDKRTPLLPAERLGPVPAEAPS